MSSVNQINTLNKILTEVSTDASRSEEVRKGLLKLLRQHVGALETPNEVIWRLMFQSYQAATVRTAMTMGLIESLVSSSKPITAAELASTRNCDKQLVVRVLRLLSAMNIVNETEYETYASNSTTKSLTDPSVAGGFKFMFDQGGTLANNLPKFLADHSFKQPEGTATNFMSAFNTQKPMFPWLMEHPEQMSDFNSFMKRQRMWRTDWFEMADVNKVLFEGYDGADENGTLLVDIGGGRGHDLEAFRNRFPDTKGKLVLQDLPAVIDDIKELRSDIVRMKYSCFDPQPIIGARAYYLGSVFHCFSDTQCRQMLSQLVAAMKPGYSKLLIFEFILPDTGSPLYPAMMDINMLAFFSSGMERTRTQWRELLGAVGLEIVKFWTVDDETEGLIEAVKRP